MRRLGLAAALTLGALGLSGCTLVSTSSAPSTINPNNVPLGLLQPTIPFTDYAQVHWVTRDIFLLDAAQKVVTVSRSMTAPPSLAAVLYYESQGPTPVEQTNGLSSQVPTTMVINQATIQGGVAFIYVSKVFSQISLAQQRIAAGQLVFTAAAMGASRGIELWIDQTPFSLKLAGGTSVRLITPAQMAYLKKG